MSRYNALISTMNTSSTSRIYESPTRAPFLCSRSLLISSRELILTVNTSALEYNISVVSPVVYKVYINTWLEPNKIFVF